MDHQTQSQSTSDVPRRRGGKTHQHNTERSTASGTSATSIKESVNEKGETQNDLNKNESSGSQETSFFPTDSESIDRTTSITEATGKIPKICQEQLHTISAFQNVDEDDRKSSMGHLQLDDTQQLLLEASQALSSVTKPTPTQRHRKTPSKESLDSSSYIPKEFKFDRGSTQIERKLPGDVLSKTDEEKADEQILKKQQSSKGAVALEEDEDDKYDLFGIPSELPVNSERYLDSTKDSMNLLPVSALTNAFYLFDGEGVHDEVIEPRTALQNAPFAKRLPMEENFDSDDDANTKTEKDIIVPKKTYGSAFHKLVPSKATKKS